MKYKIAYAVIALNLAAVLVHGQTAMLGNLRPTDMVVTNALDAAALTNYVTRADLDGKQDAGEYASPTFRFILTEPYITDEMTADVDVLDYVESRILPGGLLAVRLSAVSEGRPDADAGEVAGTFSIVGGTSPYATITNDCVLLPTGTSGPVTVEFTPADGSSVLRKTVSMTRGNAQMVLYSPSAEQDGTWRREQGDALADLFRGISTNGIASTYRHGRGNETNTYCRGILMAQQLYVTNEVANPSVVNTTFFSADIANALRCQSVGRTDFGTGPSVRPAMFVAPHYAICANHYPPSSAKFCLDRGERTFRTYTLSKVANNGDLCLLRTATDAFPTDLIPAMLRPSVLGQFSPSMLLGTVGLYQSQHGTVHPCLVNPNDGYGWSTQRPGGAFHNYGFNGAWIRNATYADLDVYGHDVHGGDSGHAVCLWLNGRLVPVGTFYTAGGSGQSLVDDAILDWLDNAIQQDSGGTESLTYLSAADLEL